MCIRDRIVSDHHVVEADGPFADAHLNPRAEETIEDLLSGAGVAYLIVEAYVSTYEVQASDRLLKTLRILAMVGTVADIMPLVGANRHLVQEAFNDFSDYAPPCLLYTSFLSMLHQAIKRPIVRSFICVFSNR